ncbi:TPA: hypothetical protein I7769_21570 [Vibrio vulnificus]|nr:hypothetical protein [Vibrio vulnificus]
MRMWNVVIRVLLLVYMSNLCVSAFYLFETHQFLESEAKHEKRLLSVYDQALENKDLSHENLSMVTKSIATELFTLGFDNVNYFNLDGGEVRFEPSQYDKVERLFRLNQIKEAKEYIQHQLLLNGVYTIIILVLGFGLKKFKTRT